MAIARGMGLRRIFQNAKIMARGDLEYRVPVRGSALKINREDGAGAWTDGAFQEFRIEISGGGIDVHKDRTSAAIGDRFGGGQKCVWSGDDFVASLHAQGEQAEMQGGGSAAQRDAVCGAAEISELAFEGLNLGAFDKRRVLAGAIERRQNLVAQTCIFSFEIEKWDFHGRCGLSVCIKTVLYCGRGGKESNKEPRRWRVRCALTFR